MYQIALILPIMYFSVGFTEMLPELTVSAVFPPLNPNTCWPGGVQQQEILGQG